MSLSAVLLEYGRRQGMATGLNFAHAMLSGKLPAPVSSAAQTPFALDLAVIQHCFGDAGAWGAAHMARAMIREYERGRVYVKAHEDKNAELAARLAPEVKRIAEAIDMNTPGAQLALRCIRTYRAAKHAALTAWAGQVKS